MIAKCIDEDTKVEVIKASRLFRGGPLMVTKDRTQMEWEKFKAQLSIVREARANNKWARLDEFDNAVVREFRTKKATQGHGDGDKVMETQETITPSSSSPQGEQRAKKE